MNIIKKIVISLLVPIYVNSPAFGMENAHTFSYTTEQNIQLLLTEKFKDVREILNKDESHLTAKLVKECELRHNLEGKKAEKSLLEKRIRNAHERFMSGELNELRMQHRQLESIIELMQKNIKRLLAVSTDC